MTLNVLIASAGRRNYLVQWFREALKSEAADGLVLVGDVDRNAPARHSADGFILLPPVSAQNYSEHLARVCEDHAINLAISLNDYENSLWAELSLGDKKARTRFLCLPRNIHNVLEDKFATHDVLIKAGLHVPSTVLAADMLNGVVSPDALGPDLVIKNRYGSGSYGLRFATADNLVATLETALDVVRNQRGEDLQTRHDASMGLVVQQRIKGTEYGLDIVNNFEGKFVGALGRKKLGMRDGETSSAVTVSPNSLGGTARALANFTRHTGLIDTDVIRDGEGKDWIIDINPRFGGGYPFSHFAGADIPRAYVRWALGRDESTGSDLLAYRENVISHKTIQMVGASADDV